MAKMKERNYEVLVKMRSNQYFHSPWWRYKLWQPLWGISLAISTIAEHMHTYDSAILPIRDASKCLLKDVY